MTTPATVPVTMDAHAGSAIEHHGLQAAVDRMIDYAREHLPEVERIEVSLYERNDIEEPLGISIDVYSRRPSRANENFAWEIIKWRAREFPPEVLERTVMDYHSGADHVG
jgi:hypothetical protein